MDIVALAGAVTTVLAAWRLRAGRLPGSAVAWWLASVCAFGAGVAVFDTLVAGYASALVFLVAASALLTGLRAHGQHLIGHGFGGVGAGIAASGVLVLVLRHGTWQDSWWSAAVLGAVLSAAARPLRPAATDDDGTDRKAGPAGRR